MATDLSNNSASLTAGKIGSPADGKKPVAPSATTSQMGVSSQVNVGPAKKVDFKDLKSGEDFRSSADRTVMPPQPAPRTETGTEGA